MDLMVNILYVFYSFSHFSQFHEIITKFKVGLVVMEAIAYEEKRREKIQSTKKKKKSDKNEKITKQENLLYVCFRILLNLAENIDIESKMRKRGLIPHLVNALNRENPELLCVLVTFLRKLSIFPENRREMLESGLFEYLDFIMQFDNPILINEVIRLLINISFEPKTRSEMMIVAPKVIEVMKSPDHFEYSIKLLYQLSQDESFIMESACIEVLPLIVLEFVVEYPGTRVSKDLIALAINLACKEIIAGVFVKQNKGLPRLMDRLLRTRDPLLAKMVRNISQHPVLAPNFKNFIPDLLGIFSKAESDEVMVEILGMFGNIASCQGAPFAPFFKQFDMVSFIFNFLKKGAKSRNVIVNNMTNVQGDKDDDILLEAIILLGAVITDEEIAAMVAESPMVNTLCGVFVEKQEDDEMVLQILHTFYKLLIFNSTRKQIVCQKGILEIIIESYQDENDKIVSVVESLMDIIADCEGQWADIIRSKRFKIHNAVWLETVSNLEKPQGVQDVDEGVLTHEESAPEPFSFNVIEMNEVGDMEIG